MISNRRNKVRCERERERQLGNSPRMCAISSHKSLPGTGIAVYRWLSCVSSTIAQHLFAPAGGGVAAHCKGIRGQCVEQEEQRPHETLAPEQAFEMMKPGVVRVYAILPELASACQQEGCMASPGRNPHVVERFHFLGSGFFFDDRGHVVTAAHVVLRLGDSKEESALNSTADFKQDQGLQGDFVPYRLAIKDSVGRIHPANLCGLDTVTDVAVLRVEGITNDNSPQTFCKKFDGARPLMGEIVATYAATEHAEESIGVAGRVLQPRQTFKSLDSSGCLGFLQLQLLTLPGMSGAPVCNMSGHVVGMLVKKFDMCGLALPSAVVRRVAEALRDTGKFTSPSIGLLVKEEVPCVASSHQKLPRRPTLTVCGVTPGEAADVAGIQEGDRIISVQGERMDSVVQLRELVVLHGGGSMDVTVRRGTEWTIDCDDFLLKVGRLQENATPAE
ncbi:Probable serine protease, related [Eimeria tenella]|uniref:Probable serine protease, related n=1 Tax=Eimeria tenella TaxID=5802 RepID=U6KUE9_EIMTE|nr:Probable serine protease, related [Eimeria tenella]CDJ41581.1 Probable serine protease, related [Eimeria tenella]|eukprot:XP_013232331.1 Probable serine protease, related [Eimeria tenella]